MRGVIMSDIFDVIDRFWGISSNKAISINIITLVLLIMLFCNFKSIRHPRYRIRIIFLTVLGLLIFNTYYFELITLNEYYIMHICIISVLIVIFSVISIYKPTLLFFPLKRLTNLVEGRFIQKSECYFLLLRFLTFTTASRLYYKKLLADNYANRHMLINAFKTLYYFNQKSLFESEIDDLEIHMASYLLQMGDITASKSHLQKVQKESILAELVSAMLDDRVGCIPDEILPKIEHALELIQPKTDPFIQAQVYAMYSNCREKQSNFEDASFYAVKALECAKKSKNKEVMCNIYEQLITLLCNNDLYDQRIDVYYDEYSKLYTNSPASFIRSYNFRLKLLRIRGQYNLIVPVIANRYPYALNRFKGIERYNWEVSNLNVAFEHRISIDKIMEDIEKDFVHFFSVGMPDRFSLINTLYKVLDLSFATLKNDVQMERYRSIWDECKKYIAHTATKDLEYYYHTLDIHQIYERYHILHLMVGVSFMREWILGVCKMRKDKILGNAHQYFEQSADNKAEHSKRIERLRQIADIADKSGLKPFYIDALINIIEACYSVYKPSDTNCYEVNLIDEECMRKYIAKAWYTISTSSTSRFSAQTLKLSAQLCVLREFSEAKKVYENFDKRHLREFNQYTLNYYRFLKFALEKYADS